MPLLQKVKLFSTLEPARAHSPAAHSPCVCHRLVLVGSAMCVRQSARSHPIRQAGSGLEKLKAAQLLILDTPFAREQEMQSGRADVFMTDYPYIQRFLANADWARLIFPANSYHLTPYAYAIKPVEAVQKRFKGGGVWCTRVRSGLTTANTLTWKQSRNKCS